MGWIAKTLAIIGIIFLIIIVITGITAYQVVGLIKTVKTEGAKIVNDTSLLSKGDCTKITEIETSVNKIKLKANGACINPLIKIVVDKMEQIPMKCKDIPALESQMTASLAIINPTCINNTTVKL